MEFIKNNALLLLVNIALAIALIMAIAKPYVDKRDSELKYEIDRNEDKIHNIYSNVDTLIKIERAQLEILKESIK